MKHVFFLQKMKYSTKIMFSKIIQYFSIFIKEFIILYNWMLYIIKTFVLHWIILFYFCIGVDQLVTHIESFFFPKRMKYSTKTIFEICDFE